MYMKLKPSYKALFLFFSGNDGQTYEVCFRATRAAGSLKGRSKVCGQNSSKPSRQDLASPNEECWKLKEEKIPLMSQLESMNKMYVISIDLTLPNYQLIQFPRTAVALFSLPFQVLSYKPKASFYLTLYICKLLFTRILQKGTSIVQLCPNDSIVLYESTKVRNIEIASHN